MTSINKYSGLQHSYSLNFQEQALKSPSIQNIPKVTILSPTPLTSAEKALSVLKLSVKIVLAPLTIFIYLITKSLSSLASNAGLGTEGQVRLVDQQKRENLLNMGGEEVKFGLKNGPLLEGMFFKADDVDPAPAKSKTILLCTGSHQSYENYAIPMVAALKSMGHHVMVFNYEGFGNSEGQKSEEGVYRSVEAAYQYLKQAKNCSDDSIVAWGYSLGSGAASELSTKHAVDIVIDRGFSSMSQVAYTSAPTGLKTIAKIIFIVGAHFNNLSKLTKAKGHVLIAQGNADATMEDVHHGQKLRRAIENNPNAFFREVDSEHMHGNHVWFSDDPDREVVKNFLNR